MPFRPIRTEPSKASVQPPPPDNARANPRARARPTIQTPRNEDLDRTTITSRAKRSHHKVDRTGPNYDENGDYIVGKYRPPKANQWPKNQSGNPRGPTKRETLRAEAQFEKTFLEPFSATVNGETVPLTMDVFVVQSLKNAAAKGSVKAAQILLDVYVRLIRKVADQDPGPEVDSWEKESIDRLLAELGLPERPVVRQTDRAGAKP